VASTDASIRAQLTGSGFFSIPGANHQRGWEGAPEVLPHVRPFLESDAERRRPR
jgi:hypothetical protein